MKKSLLLACLFSVCAVSSFAQSPVNDAGAKRDAAYAKTHPAAMNSTLPIARHANKRHSKHRHHVTRKAMK